MRLGDARFGLVGGMGPHRQQGNAHQQNAGTNGNLVASLQQTLPTHNAGVTGSRYALNGSFNRLAPNRLASGMNGILALRARLAYTATHAISLDALLGPACGDRGFVRQPQL